MPFHCLVPGEITQADKVKFEFCHSFDVFIATAFAFLQLVKCFFFMQREKPNILFIGRIHGYMQYL